MTTPPDSPTNEPQETAETSRDALVPKTLIHKEITPELQQQISKFEAGAILLFDEADTLFNKRSEVKDSHDRYANPENDPERYAGD